MNDQTSATKREIEYRVLSPLGATNMSLKYDNLVLLLVSLLMLILISGCSMPRLRDASESVMEIDTPDPPQFGQINIADAIVREAADVSSPEVLRLPSGIVVMMAAIQEQWVKIETPKIPAGSGWILTNFLTVITTFDAEVDISALNVRTGPGTGYQPIDVIRQSVELMVIGHAYECSWLHVVTLDGVQGWVSAPYVTYSVACARIPIAYIPPMPSPSPQRIVQRVSFKSELSAIQFEPLDAVVSGKQLFKWATETVLKINEGFEIVLWQIGQDPVTHGFGIAEPTRIGEKSVDFEMLSRTLPHLLQGGEEYMWGVLLVEISPYRRLQYLGGGQRFQFEHEHRGSNRSAPPSRPMVESKPPPRPSMDDKPPPRPPPDPEPPPAMLIVKSKGR